MYHAMACLTVAKLLYLGEHSEVSQENAQKVNKRFLKVSELEQIVCFLSKAIARIKC